jgi:AcrR family transcriptional regulator
MPSKLPKKDRGAANGLRHEPKPPEPSARMRSSDRRKQIVRVASDLLAAQGVDRVRVPSVAEAAGVTRAVVYRFFPSRQALLAAILEDFRADLEVRFAAHEGLLRTNRVMDTTVHSFVGAACESIDAMGAGGWFLLGTRGPDPEISELAEEHRSRLYGPWLARVANVIDVPERLVPAVSEMVIASSRAVMRLYIEQKLSRDEAASALGRGVEALLGEFGPDR